MKYKEIEYIVNKVHFKLMEEFEDIPKIEIHNNIYERLSGIEGMTGTSCAQGEYDWDTNTIYLYSSRLFDEETVIRTILHEITHSSQPKNLFEEIYKVGVSYEDHPFELEARKAEEQWVKYKINTNVNG
tara:strand:+ start:45 stop:431 length:387 start_codon:yes stop_codon:yes gene_type:complete